MCSIRFIKLWPVNWGYRVERAREKKPFVPQGIAQFLFKGILAAGH